MASLGGDHKKEGGSGGRRSDNKQLKNQEQAEVIDEIIERRLLFDGDGRGDEKRLQMFLRSYLEFSNNCSGTVSLEERKASFLRTRHQLQYMASIAERTAEAIKATEKSTQGFANTEETIRAEVEGTRGCIAELRRLLDEANVVRRRKMEYDALVASCESAIGGQGEMGKMTASEMRKKRDELERELRALEAEKERLNKKLDERKRALSCLSYSVRILNEAVMEGEAPEEDNDEGSMEGECGYSRDFQGMESVSAFSSQSSNEAAATDQQCFMEVETEVLKGEPIVPLPLFGGSNISESSLEGFPEKEFEGKMGEGEQKQNNDKSYEDLTDSDFDMNEIGGAGGGVETKDDNNSGGLCIVAEDVVSSEEETEQHGGLTELVGEGDAQVGVEMNK